MRLSLFVPLWLCLSLGCNEETAQDQITRAAAYDICDAAPVNGPWMPDGACQEAIGKQIAAVGACCSAYCDGQPLCEAGCISSDIDKLIEALNYCPAVADTALGKGPK